MKSFLVFLVIRAYDSGHISVTTERIDIQSYSIDKAYLASRAVCEHLAEQTKRTNHLDAFCISSLREETR